MIIYYLIVVSGVFACSVSQLLLKKSAMVNHSSFFFELFNIRVIVAYTIMLITLVTNIYAMSHGVMLKDMPILEATGYIFVPILSSLFLKEKISNLKILSISFILIGIMSFYY